MRRLHATAVFGLLSCALAGCAAPGPGAPPAAASGPGSEGEPALVVRRDDFERRVLLTGALEAEHAIHLTVPRTPSWQVELRWVAEDGSAVQAGERVVELDSSEFVTDLEEKEISLAERLSELERRRAELASQAREKEFEAARRRAELEKAEIGARVPEGIVPRQTLAERRLELDRARLALAKAEADLDSHRRSAEADLEVLDIEIRKARREIEAARRAITALTLTAPEDGIFLMGRHPWEDRKFQEGDTVWVGLSVGTLPDLSSLMVDARLPDVDDGSLAPGMPAEVTLDTHPGETYPGTVREVAPVAQDEDDSLRRFFRAAVDLERTDPDRMIPGMSARVEVIVERRPECLLVPRAALATPPPTAAGGPGRVALAGGGHAEVVLGPCNEVDCVVEEGLDAGTRLALARRAGLAAASTAGERRPEQPEETAP
ncbi:MAG: HlyD family secretion protein [Thermoanaerobaculia bacterium]